jgi:flagella synthesis protein FlgN
MATQTPPGTLAALEQERDRVREFLRLLEREQTALVSGEHDHLLAYTEQKAARLLELRRYADTRNRMLDAEGLPADRNGMSTWLDRHPDPQISRTWDELMKLTARVRETNDVNGVLVAARLKHNQASIAALQSAARTSSVYGPDGGTRLAASSTRSLASV